VAPRGADPSWPSLSAGHAEERPSRKETGLRRAAADGLPAILETSNPANVEVYRRAGWEVVLVVTAERLTIWIM
jgi:hypothetical protein